VGDRLLKLVDSGGEVLVLRPEMTVPLARLAATRLLPADGGPLRLAYVAPVFRSQERGSGRLREFTQAGVELIGDGGVGADVEVIALAAEALQTAGVEQPSVSVGHAGFLRGLLAALPPETADVVRELLYRRAFAELGAAVAPGPALDALRLLPTLHGPEALERARPLAASEESREALEVLRDVLDGVAAYGLPARVQVNLGLIRDFDYYSGTVFEAHAPRAGMPLLGGGRYDGLLARFGRPAPATGFAIGLERVLEAAPTPEAGRPTVAVAYVPRGYGRAVRIAARLREVGFATVVVSADPGLPDAACTVAVTEAGFTVRAAGPQRSDAADEITAAVRAALEGP
ncbi:MAG: ATP phosphoribosyltransferase regulatory subunit, partial [Armatimonadota bacterium]|nr:ATP phosphoribosyltransferase regulatory subunit [Armatimonadota bacterium]